MHIRIVICPLPTLCLADHTERDSFSCYGVAMLVSTVVRVNSQDPTVLKREVRVLLVKMASLTVPS